MNDIKGKVGEYIRLTQRAAEIKARLDTLKGEFETQGLLDLGATKVKTVDYWGDNGKIEVGRSETVAPAAVKLLRQIFGASYDDLVKPKESLEMTAACKQLLAPIFLGNYIETPIDDVIAAAAPDNEKQRATLRKKLRGNFKTDKKALQSIVGMPEQDAEYYAYMAVEAIAYDRFKRILAAGGWTGPVQEAVDIVKTAVVVTEGVKVAVDAPKEDD